MRCFASSIGMATHTRATIMLLYNHSSTIPKCKQYKYKKTQMIHKWKKNIKQLITKPWINRNVIKKLNKTTIILAQRITEQGRVGAWAPARPGAERDFTQRRYKGLYLLKSAVRVHVYGEHSCFIYMYVSLCICMADPTGIKAMKNISMYMY